MNVRHPPAPPTLSQYRSRAPHPSRQTGGRGQSAGAARPPVSIITVARNAAATIEATIQSVLSQGVEGLEYVIVDGGSTDGTLDILRRYEDRLAVWISEPDKGISDAFNKGLALASGEVIGLINADDVYTPDAVATSLAALRGGPGCDFTFGHLVVERLDGTTPLFEGDPRYDEKIQWWMPRLNHPTIFMRRRAYEQFGLFRLDYRIAMDYDFLLRLHQAGLRGLLVPKVMVRMGGGGVSNSLVLRGYKECLRAALGNHGDTIAAVREYTLQVAGFHAKRALLKVGATGMIRTLRKLRFGDEVQ